MKNYNKMTCGELKRRLDKINNDLFNFPSMSQVEKDSLIYERMNIEGVLLHKIAAILDECEEEA